MAPATTHGHEDEHSQRRLEQDIRNTISSLTRHLTALGKSATPLSDTRGTADLPPNHNGLRILTLTGSNNGAAMKVNRAVGEVEETHGMLLGDEKSMRAYTNSNYQAVNNSVLLGGSCTAEDPGVHFSFLDFGEEEEDGREKKGRKKMAPLKRSELRVGNEVIEEKKE